LFKTEKNKTKLLAGQAEQRDAHQHQTWWKPLSSHRNLQVQITRIHGPDSLLFFYE
jgi:hypothetical protein